MLLGRPSQRGLHVIRPITGIKASFTRGAGETESVRAITGPIRVIGLVNHSAGLHNHDVICGYTHKVSGNSTKSSFAHKVKQPESTEHIGNLYKYTEILHKYS